MNRILLGIVICSLTTACSQTGEITERPASLQAAKLETKNQAAPGVEEQIRSLEEMCAATADARSARHSETPLYERLGGEEKIHALLREVVRLHLQNEEVKHFFDGLDADKVAERVAQFVISGTGGPEVYIGPDLKTSHEHMRLTNADFLSAGGDVIQAMKNLSYGEEEINEVVCILVSLRDQVVLGE